MHTLVIVVAAVVLVAAYVALMALVGSCLNLHGRPPAPPCRPNGGQVMALTYYKAVRPDGTDVRTGTVDYAGHLASWLSVIGEPVIQP